MAARRRRRSRYNFGKAERDRDRGLPVDSRSIQSGTGDPAADRDIFLYIRCGDIVGEISGELIGIFKVKSWSFRWH